MFFKSIVFVHMIIIVIFFTIEQQILTLPIEGNQTSITSQDELDAFAMSQSFFKPNDVEETQYLNEDMFPYGGFCTNERDRVLNEINNETTMIKTIIQSALWNAAIEIAKQMALTASLAATTMQSNYDLISPTSTKLLATNAIVKNLASIDTTNNDKQIKQMNSNEIDNEVEKIIHDGNDKLSMLKNSQEQSNKKQQLTVAARTIAEATYKTGITNAYKKILSIVSYLTPTTIQENFEIACDHIRTTYLTAGKQNLNRFKKDLLESIGDSNDDPEFLDKIKSASYETLGCRTSGRVVTMHKMCQMLTAATGSLGSVFFSMSG